MLPHHMHGITPPPLNSSIHTFAQLINPKIFLSLNSREFQDTLIRNHLPSILHPNHVYYWVLINATNQSRHQIAICRPWQLLVGQSLRKWSNSQPEVGARLSKAQYPLLWSDWICSSHPRPSQESPYHWIHHIFVKIHLTLLGKWSPVSVRYCGWEGLHIEVVWSRHLQYGISCT